MGFRIGWGSRHRKWMAALIVFGQLFLRSASAQETVNYASVSGRGGCG
jgi:hypothetical protein